MSRPMRRRDYSCSRQLRKDAHRLIPGGCHTYAKGDDQFPEEAPGFIVSGDGCRVIDVDGNEFIEYGMGLRAVALGHAYPPVVAAAAAQLELGSNFTRPAAIEVDCARLFLSALPGYDCVKFAKDGSATTSAAVKLARAHTGRELVAICRDHPFFSSDDWFIGTTETNSGIPPAVRELTLGFSYNDAASLEALFNTHPDRIAAVVLEPVRTEEPTDGFLERVRTLCDRHGAVLVFDEMIAGFRMARGGGCELYGVRPDLATFGKAMANGFALSALAGCREIMELGGLLHDRERVFLLSTTHGAETHAMAAGMATVREYLEQPVIDTLYERGRQLREGVSGHTRRLGLEGHFRLAGRDCNLQFATLDAEGRHSQGFRTLFLQEMLARGIITPSFVVSYSHDRDAVEETVVACGEALEVYRRALANGLDTELRGRPVKPVNRRFN